MTSFFRDAEACREVREVRARLFVNLILDSGQVHGDVAAVSEAQRLDDMHDVQFGSRGGGQRVRACGHAAALFGEIDGEQDSAVVSHVPIASLSLPPAEIRRDHTPHANAATIG